MKNSENKTVIVAKTDKEVLPVIPTETYVGLGYDGNKITVQLPKNGYFLDDVMKGGEGYEFPFLGNKDSKSRSGVYTRSVDFNVILPKEVNRIYQMDLCEGRFVVTALKGEKSKIVKGLKTTDIVTLGISIQEITGKWYANMLDVKSAIDVIGLLLHATDWNEGHAYYKSLVLRTVNSKSSKPMVVVKQKEGIII